MYRVVANRYHDTQYIQIQWRILSVVSAYSGTGHAIYVTVFKSEQNSRSVETLDSRIRNRDWWWINDHFERFLSNLSRIWQDWNFLMIRNYSMTESVENLKRYRPSLVSKTNALFVEHFESRIPRVELIGTPTVLPGLQVNPSTLRVNYTAAIGKIFHHPSWNIPSRRRPTYRCWDPRWGDYTVTVVALKLGSPKGNVIHDCQRWFTAASWRFLVRTRRNVADGERKCRCAPFPSWQILVDDRARRYQRILAPNHYS